MEVMCTYASPDRGVDLIDILCDIARVTERIAGEGGGHSGKGTPRV